jgi:hypothetical protein
MKLTQNKAYHMLTGLKSGLSIPLAIILLMSAFQPMQARAATSEGVASLFEVGQSEFPEVLEAESTSTVQDVLLKVCLERGYGQACAQHLLGMLWKESNNIANAVGDRGKARGYFQIWVKLHNISVDCAEDLECSANWTLTYMERNSYPRYVAYAIQCHNGCNIDNGYAASAMRHGKRLWDSPLAIVKTSEVAMVR